MPTILEVRAMQIARDLVTRSVLNYNVQGDNAEVPAELVSVFTEQEIIERGTLPQIRELLFQPLD